MGKYWLQINMSVNSFIDIKMPLCSALVKEVLGKHTVISRYLSGLYLNVLPEFPNQISQHLKQVSSYRIKRGTD